MPQQSIAAGTPGANQIICMAGASAITIASVSLKSAQALTADDTVFDTMQIHDYSASGVDGGYMAAASFGTTITDDGHTGDWFVGVTAFTWTPAGGYMLAAGHTLIAQWDCSNGGGTTIEPGNAWRIVTQ